ncbi:sensor histidine kinase [Streptomyces griseorubiginosus]|uniref:sensor histidine kinase n=1 Tax=Streptomyces griseorubiginosus TaxID=67304 RepID=UPI0011405D78|nr:ATP-binding protein [Streptomyces griseorubiginosus]
MTGTRTRPRRRPRATRTRLLLLVGATLVVVCGATALTTALFQRAYVMGEFDGRVVNAAERSLGGAALHPSSSTYLGFLRNDGNPSGTLAARLSGEGKVLSAAVVTQDAPPRDLDPAQRAALTGLHADGSRHTRILPGLGAYRVTVLRSGDVQVLTGLPTADVENMLRHLVLVEAAVAATGLAVACCVCAVVVRRQLRPLGRVAATAAEVARAPLGPGDALTRVPVHDTDPDSEAGQVGAALNHLLERVRHSEESVRDGEERVRRGEEQVRRGEERMRRFLADASHELRTPLASIAGYAELVNRGTGVVDPVLAWRRVSTESARMTALVEDLLLLARLDESNPLQAVRVDLAPLVAEAVWEARSADSGHDWQLELPLDQAAMAAGDALLLRRAVAALLSNARTHTPVGTRIVTSVAPSDDHCAISVRDDGPGIPPTLLPTVFERFTRADTSRSRADASAGGSGLGLSLALAITEAHGGRVTVHSAPGRTEFTIRLPRATEPGAESGSDADVRTAALPLGLRGQLVK